MAQNVAQKLIESHLMDGEMTPGKEIALKIDQTLTQDATGTLVMLELEAMKLEVRKLERLVELEALAADRKPDAVALGATQAQLQWQRGWQPLVTEAAAAGSQTPSSPLPPNFPWRTAANPAAVAAIAAVRAALPAEVALSVLPPFYADPGYLDAQAALIEDHLPAQWDHLLLSYHGLPERHITTADPTDRARVEDREG